MITNHFFNLIQCYSEQGLCYFKDYSFGMLSTIIVPLSYFILVGLFILAFYIGWKLDLFSVPSEQKEKD
jgi:hypothetical protein